MSLLLLVILSFVAFSLVASAGYVLNDLMDYPADRKHPAKRHRPLAAGLVSMPAAVALISMLLAAGMALSLALPPVFGWLLFVYLVLSTAYSVYFKEKLLLDVIFLAWLYTHRIVAGGAVIATGVSPWLMAFSMFLFLSLALVKRYTELRVMEETYGALVRRDYMPADLELIRSIGPASGYLCVLVFCLYINGPDVVKLYRHPDILWSICPVLLYWITRIWFLAHRKQLLDDPVLFALKDRTSYIAGAIVAAILIMAT